MSGKRKNIVILGSTGSIGENAVKVALSLPGELRVVGLAAASNVARLAEHARLLECPSVAIADASLTAKLAEAVPAGCSILGGMEGVLEMVAADEVDMVLCAIVGAESLRPVLETLRSGKDLALASKEALVMAGALVMGAASTSGARILPVDSEHSAVFQCVGERSFDKVSKIFLTASGGAFRDWLPERMRSATLEDALTHPTWSMGPKVTIDSATLMNKALEIVEAGWFFGIPGEKIEVLIHRESVVHSMVEFIDGSVIAQLGAPDMRHPIQYALTYPNTFESSTQHLDFAKFASLSFEVPDRAKYPSLNFAYEALNAGGTMPAVMNAA
ncbi:MAG: 1-deoxy-D-xylulose-5-phosphate reductoisomerase, partial [Victivallales bacterium]|nr:1-deoxy-D-xylulose-5-phosphate reductoisomerase [Victivallales bacterium]